MSVVTGASIVERKPIALQGLSLEVNSPDGLLIGGSGYLNAAVGRWVRFARATQSWVNTQPWRTPRLELIVASRPDLITLAGMWMRLRERLFSVAGVVVLILWFFASAAIATGPLGLEAQRANLGILMLIFLAPAGAVVVVQELVHRIRFGPTKPGRHSRGALDPEVLSELDKGLKRRDGDTPPFEHSA